MSVRWSRGFPARIPFVLAACLCFASDIPPDRVPVPGGRYRAGTSSDLLRKAQALCLSTSPAPESCGRMFKNEGRRATRALKDFLVDRLEVSQERYRKCVGAGACTPADWPACRYGDDSIPSTEERAVLQKDRHPVVCATFEQARAFCRWSGGELPDEAQWEKAAGGERLFPWGEKWDPARLNWGDDGAADGFRLTAPVGSFPSGASPYRAEDMVGNVWEWALRLPELDEDGAPERQVIRGAGFAAAPNAQRVHKRAPYDAARGYPNVGFRCVYRP